MTQPTPLTQTLAANVVQRRRAAHLSQTALAERAAVSRATISNIERALYDPTLATIERIADALGVSVLKLFAPARDALRKIYEREDIHV